MGALHVIYFGGMPNARRGQHIRFLPEGEASIIDLSGYRAVLSHDDLATDYPVVDRLRESDHFRDGDIVVLEAIADLSDHFIGHIQSGAAATASCVPSYRRIAIMELSHSPGFHLTPPAQCPVQVQRHV